MTSVRPGRLLAVAAVSGVIAGVVFSGIRGRRLEEEAAQLEAQQVLQVPKSRPKSYAMKGKTVFVDPEAVKYLPEYPKAVVTDLAQTTAGQGVPLKAGMFMTPDSVEAVLGFYKRELEKAGWFTVTQHWGDSAAYVGFYGPDKHMHTVAVMRSGSQTLAFLANSDPEAYLQANAAQQFDALPTMPKLSGALKFTFDDEGVRRTTYYAKTGVMSVAQAADFYRQGLPGLGWREKAAAGPKATQHERLEFSRAGEELSLTLSRDERESNVAIFAHLLSRR